MRSDGFGFVAAACALLAVDWVVLRVSSVEESKVDIVAYHRACCMDKELHPIAAVDNSYFFDKWAQTLGMFDGINCIHTYGLGVKANSCEDCDWPKAIHNEDWTFRREHVKGDVLSKNLSCAAIQLFVADTNPIEHPLGAFTPELIRELTKRKPKVTIETGFAFRDGSSIKFHSRDRSDYLYDQVYEADKKTKRKQTIFSDEVRRTIVTREMIREALPRDSVAGEVEGVIAFLNYAAEGRAPRKQEVKVLLFQNQLESILTTEKLDEVQFSAQISDLRRRLGISRSPWTNKVRHGDLDRVKRTKSGRKETQMNDRVREHQDHGLMDLTRIGAKPLRDALLLGIYRLAHESTESRLKLSGITRAGDKNPPNPEELTEFLLVNSLLTVSNSSHEEVFIEAMENELASQRRPIFSACAPHILASSCSSAEGSTLPTNCRFAFLGQPTVAYSYGTLSDIPVTEKGLPKDHTDGDDGNAGVDCVMLALQNVSESEFQLLGRKRLTVLMAVTRSARLRDRPHVVMGDARQGVDLWSYFSGEDSQPIHQLFDKFGEEIKKTGSWLPALVEKTVERSRAKASRNESIKSAKHQRLERRAKKSVKHLVRSTSGKESGCA